MAIDFPNSPSVNDLYTAGGKTWQWNGTYWSAYGTGPVLRTSDTAPVSPNTGDMWYETDTGRLYTYVDNTWVEIANSNDVMQTPPGVISSYAGSTSPTGWLICDGSAVSRATYASLFSVVSTTYGSGDGSTTFNIPNLKGRVPIGYDSSDGSFNQLNASGGAKSTILTTSHLPLHDHSTPNHTHTVSLGTHAHENYTTANPGSGGPGTRVDYDYDGSGSWAYPQGTVNNYTNNSVTINSSGASTSGTAGQISPTAVTALQPYIVVNYIIKV